MTPLVHDFTDSTVLIFGGGVVGARKARRFDSAARVVVISPDFDDDLVRLRTDHNSNVDLVRARPDVDEVAPWLERVTPTLVVAATDDPALNESIESVALDNDCLVNRTDTAGERVSGSVIVPATSVDGPVTVAISTSGVSPALSRALRERIDAEIEGAGAMATLSGELRTELQERGVDPDRRREAIRAVVRSEPVWKALQAGESNARDEANTVIAEVLGK